MFSFIKNITEKNKISVDDIHNIEKQYAIQFPEALVDFLVEYNGSEIFLSEIIRNGLSYEVASLIPIKHGRLPMEKVLEWDRQDAIVKEGLIPIASDRGGNVYYLDSQTGNIIFYNVEDIENPKLVSDSLEEFLSQMTVLVK